MKANIALTHAALEGYQRAILEAVCLAGDRLVAMQPAIRQLADAETKSDGTLVTAADFASEDIILRTISAVALRPHRIISEEREPSSVANPGHQTWFVDPLDGTRAYLEGSTDFAILVSAWSGKTPTFSIVYYPAMGELAVAVGRRAISTTSTPHAAANASPASVMYACYMCSPKLRQLATESVGAEFRENVAESTRALLDVATGAATAAVVLLCGHKSWDLAPLLHLISASEGYVSDETGRPVSLHGTGVTGSYVVASRDRLLQQRLVTATQNLAISELRKETT